MSAKPKASRLFLFTLICCTALFSCAQQDPPALAAAKKNVRRFWIAGRQGSCTLTIVSPKRALTAAHCIPDPTVIQISENITITFAAPLETAGDAIQLTAVFVSHYTDTAVLEGNFSASYYPPVDDNEGLVYSVDEAVLCGYPMFNKVMRCTRVKRVKNAGFSALFETTVIPGQSGGAVFSLDGKLIGIIQYMTSDGLAGVGSVTGVQSGADVAQ